MEQLREIRLIVSDLINLPDDKREMQNEIAIVMKGVELYKNKYYSEIIEVISISPADTSLNKHRILGGAYFHLYQEAVADNRSDDATKYLGLAISYASRYSDLADRANRRRPALASSNLGVAYLLRNGPGDMDQACKLFAKARNEAPGNWEFYVNHAACYVKKSDFKSAMA